MQQHDLDKGIAGSIAGRAEVTAAISSLIEEVARLAHQVKRFAAMVDVVEATRAADAISNAATRVTDTIEQPDSKVAPAVAACGTYPADNVESANVQLSRQDNETSELNWGANDPSKGEAGLVETQDASRTENPFAERVLIVRDRLGGLIQPIESPPSQPPDPDTD